ncbi:unnamed protein product [Adineta ricciae]|uniref:SH3 domain-containing protein n=1 Tax=Adineta ricciae TaxID=249248 RepID=A0A813PMD9_ADIRI|nr:unnamed protein product [Adineta ricciae]
MWKKIKEILSYKDETTIGTTPSTISASVIDLKPLSTTSSRRTETLHHPHQQQQHHHRRPYRKIIGKSTLNKTDEHCRSLFNLLPTSLRPRHHQQNSSSKGADASTATKSQLSPSIGKFRTDYDSGYMSQSVLNRTSSYASCYSAVATTMPVPSMVRQGSIESLLNGYSKSNPANIRVLVRKNFEPFAQAHIAVTKGTIVTALFARGPWLYIRIESTGQTGYIPRIICSLYKSRRPTNDKSYYHHHHLSLSSTDSSSNKDDELDLTVLSSNNKSIIRPYQQQQQQQQPMNRYLSHSSAFIYDRNDSVDHSKKRLTNLNFAERERRNTCTLSQPPPLSAKDRRLTLNSVNWPIIATNGSETAAIHQPTDILLANNTDIAAIAPPPPPPRDTDSSSTQDSGYSESTPYFLVHQITPETEQLPTVVSASKNTTSSPQYATVRRSSLLKTPDTTNTYHNSLRRQQQTIGSHHSAVHRHTLLNGQSMSDMLTNDTNKRHSFGAFYLNGSDDYDKLLTKSTHSTNSRPIDFALIRTVRRDKDDLYQRTKPAIHNLPKSHRQIPASIILNHHRQQQKHQFGSSHSAFRPVQPTIKSKRASSEGHSPSNEPSMPSSLTVSSTSTSLSSSTASLSNLKKSHLLKQRRLSCDIPIPVVPQKNTNSLSRSIGDSAIPKKLNNFSRTMSEILCDQFSELNVDAIEKDSLVQPVVDKNGEQTKAIVSSQQTLFTITKDYRSSRASFSVKRGDCVQVLKQVGRACFLVRKQNNGQVGFLPKALMLPTTTTKIDTFLEMHGCRETVI